MRVLGRDEADAQLMSKFWRVAGVQGRRSRRCTPPGSRTSRRRPTRCCSPSAPTSPCRRWSSPAPPGRAPRSSSAARSPGRPPVRRRTRRTSPTRCSTTSGSRSRRCTRRGSRTAGSTHNHVVVDGTTVGIDGFELATGAAAPGRRAADVAELLVSTAVVVGDDRAVAAARAGSVTTRSSKRSPTCSRRRSAARCGPTAATARSARSRWPTLREAAGVGDRERPASAPGAPPGQRHQPDDGGRHAHRDLRPAEPGRQPAGAVGHDHERRHLAG